MKYFHLEGEINEQLLDKFIQFRNENESEEWTIVLNSVGGKINIMHVILDDINNRHKRTVLISAGIFSAAFSMFYFANCEKRITMGSTGMTHLRSNQLSMQSNGQPEFSQDECIVKNWKETKEIDSFEEAFMTKPEIKKYKKGSDVFFTFKRMKEIFPDAKII